MKNTTYIYYLCFRVLSGFTTVHDSSVHHSSVHHSSVHQNTSPMGILLTASSLSSHAPLHTHHPLHLQILQALQTLQGDTQGGGDGRRCQMISKSHSHNKTSAITFIVGAILHLESFLY